MIKRAILAAAAAAALAGPVAAQPRPGIVLPDDAGLRAVACSAILSATAQSMQPAEGAASPMAVELSQFAGRWKVQARALLAANGSNEAATDKLIADRLATLWKGPGQGLPPGTFVAAQTCQAEAEHLPAA